MLVPISHKQICKFGVNLFVLPGYFFLIRVGVSIRGVYKSFKSNYWFQHMTQMVSSALKLIMEETVFRALIGFPW